jgi:hypothetical protein
MTRPFRGNSDQLAADAPFVSAVSSSLDHRTRRATQVSARRSARLRLVRPGRCRLCKKTFTIQLSWWLPYAHYTLRCRQQAWDAVCTDGARWEQSAPLCKDPARLPDPSTVRRWAHPHPSHSARRAEMALALRQNITLPGPPLFIFCSRPISCFPETEKPPNLLFMKTVVIANQKGGSGKSTSTVHLAVAAEQAGDGPVVICDTDPQGNTVDWFNQRKRAGFDTPRYAPLTSSVGPAVRPTWRVTTPFCELNP